MHKTKEQRRVYAAAWRKANPEKTREYAKRWYQANPDTVRIKRRRQQGILNPTAEKKYGPCEACGAVQHLHMDHDHVTGKVRGWLCFRCNVALGFLETTPEIVDQLKTYLTRRLD